ncbi:MAG: hypothetical protein KDD58_02865 [Bdellovibrionales bacterium]|nr:hypothetical protein [Bdellovibrionales bacterium]
MKAKKIITNSKGMATFEAVPLIVLFVMLVGYALGLWGVVHKATLSSIGARQYAFDTLRNRANYMYFVDYGGNANLHHKNYGYRYHAITDPGERFNAPNTPITVGKKPKSENLHKLNVDSQELHNVGIFDLQKRNQKVEFSHAWIMTGYGICINAECGAPE